MKAISRNVIAGMLEKRGLQILCIYQQTFLNLGSSPLGSDGPLGPVAYVLLRPRAVLDER